MKIAVIVVRVLMGLLFLFASIVVLFNLVEQPEMTGRIKVFNDGIAASGYLLTLIKVTELACGLAFVSGYFVPLATVVIAPVIINIFLFHLFVDQTGLPVAIFLVAANAFVAYFHREKYKPLFELR
jgi:putative oxidoreductase